MECERIRRSLSPLLDGELDDGESRLVVTHLQSCSPCAQEYEELKRLTVILSNLESAVAPGYLHHRIEQRVGRSESIGPWSRLVHRFVYVPALVALLFGLLIGNHLGQNISERLTSVEDNPLAETNLDDYPPASLADVYLDGWE